ncbi:MAG: phosphotransferase family protein [Solirubrobacterales bacterium]
MAEDPGAPPAPDDTIDVRADERFDEAILARYLIEKLEGAEGPLTVRQFGGGAANLTYLLRYGDREYVLRRPPLGPVAPSAHDMAREHRVLSVLHRAFPPAPRAFLFCEDPGVIGAPFFVMERRRGIVVRRKVPAAFAAAEDAPRRMSLALVDALAALHAVDYAALGLETLGKPAGFLERQIEGWLGRWERARLEEVADMTWVHDWLRERRPHDGSAALVHNDYKLDNVMLASDDPGRLVAIFDWDMCTLGDPLSDLGSLLCYWSEASDPPDFRGMSMMPAVAGFPTRAELVERYAARSGTDVRDIAFYHVLGLYRLAVIAAQIYVRFHRGQTRDQRFAAFGPLVPVVAAAARARAGEG